MNKIYKIVWSKVKQCYVVASELAKSHTKSPKSGIVRRTLIAGVLVSILNVGVANNIEAAGWIHASPPLRQDDTALVEWGIITANGTSVETDGVHDPYNITVYKNLKTGTYRFVKQATGAEAWREDAELGTNEVLDAFRASSMQEVYDMLNMGGPSYIAGTGITISSDNKVSVKAGTNVTVDENGVSVTGNGSVASGNTGLINGGTAYSELRPSANGNYVIQLELYNFISSFPLFCSFLTIP